jgi:hypothetical protein
LPRATEEVGTTPCPVCASNAGIARPERVAGPVAPLDEAVALPADAAPLTTRSRGWPGRVLLVAGGFVAGVVVAAVILHFLPAAPADRTSAETAGTPEAAVTPSAVTPVPPADETIPPASDLPFPASDVTPVVTVGKPAAEPGAGVVGAPALADGVRPPQVAVIELNDPEGTFSLPRGLRAGTPLFLRGKVGALHLISLAPGSFVDASGLEAGDVYVNGAVSGGANLRLNAPNGRVNIKGRIEEKSVVEITAAGGDVRINSSGVKPGQVSIDGGSRVTVVARGVEVRGAIGGDGTRVMATLDKAGWLRVGGGVQGTAVVEYRTAAADDRTVDVMADPVAPTAVFRRIE